MSAPMPEPSRPYANESTGELLRNVAESARDLVSQELAALAGEVREEVSDAKAAVKLAAIGGSVTLIGAIVLSVALAEALALVLPRWGAFALVGAVIVAAGVAMLVSGASKAKDADMIPEKALRNVKKDARWIKNETETLSAARSSRRENS